MRNPVNPINMTNITGRNFLNHWPKLANSIAISGSQDGLPKMDWDHMCPSPDCKHPSFYRQITEVLNDSTLNKTVFLPTRDSNILERISFKSRSTGILPPIWKDGNVAPLYKKGERSNPANSRPISLTCILCKKSFQIRL